MNHDTREDRDDLWALLGKARTAKASPAFPRDVLRRVRMEETSPEPGFLEWLRSGWNWLALAGTAAAVAMVLAATQPRHQARQIAAAEGVEIDEVVRSPDFSVIANLDVLMAMDENDLWLEGARH